MNDTVQQVVKQIANEALALFKAILEDDKTGRNDKTGKNTLKDKADDIKLKVETGDNIVIKLLYDDYLTYLEKDRPPATGNFPPQDKLRDWALARNIPADNGTLFLIARAIWRDGHKGRPVLASLAEQIEKKFATEWYAKLFEAMIDELNKCFNEWDIL
ncbi:MAG: hypothetical protein LBN74_07845 [Prevotella sp.]|jgi:hypothetical protein|nr:hypothetical protein [Prevotella sp.]